MVTFEIYTEGGGTKFLNSSLIAAFRAFFKNAGLNTSIRPIMCGPRVNAFKQFKNAINHANPNIIPLLLIDSETSFDRNITKWNFLKNKPDDQWDKPITANEDSVFLMVQCMESWFLADREMLNNFYGQEFNINALPKNQHIEEISKTDVSKALDNATRNTQKGKYNKGRHSPELLKLLNPNLVVQASPHVMQLIDKLKS